MAGQEQKIDPRAYEIFYSDLTNDEKEVRLKKLASTGDVSVKEQVSGYLEAIAMRRSASAGS